MTNRLELAISLQKVYISQMELEIERVEKHAEFIKMILTTDSTYVEYNARKQEVSSRLLGLKVFLDSAKRILAEMEGNDDIHL